MKRRFILAMTVVMALTMPGCGSGAPAVSAETAPIPSAGPVQETVTFETETPKADALTAEEADPEETEAETPHRHHYIDGVCSCGRAANISKEPLGSEWYQEQEVKGTLEERFYYADFVDGSGRQRNTLMSVYAPPGYDPDRQYNVIVFVDPGWPHADLFAKKFVEGVGGAYGSNFFDTVFNSGDAEPCIIATTYQRHDTSGSSPEQLEYEIKNYVLPYIAENYSTYAEDGSYESLCAAREHLAMGGLSNYSQYTFRAGLMRSTDMFSRFVCLSGTCNLKETIEALKTAEQNGNGLSYFFYGLGEFEWRLYSDQGAYSAIVEACDSLEDGDTAMLCPISGEHNYST